MTKPRDYSYQIQYNDNTYRVVQWTKSEFKEVCKAIVNGDVAVALDDGVFVIHEIRAIVQLKEEFQDEKTKEENKYQPPEYFVDQLTEQWLKEQGIDPVRGGFIGE